MDKEKKNVDDEVSAVSNEDTVPAQIQAFSEKLGEETGNKFTCYIYRIIRDEDSGRLKKPLVQKYHGVEPDPFEIATKHRGGTYLIQFIWRVKGQQRNKSYTLDVDEEAFPPLPKNGSGENAVVPYDNQTGVPDSMRLQLAMMHEISEVMKAAYTGGGRVTDPMEQFSGLMATMENAFTNAMTMQQKIMERVMKRNMEQKFGLSDDVTAESSAMAGGNEIDQSMVSRYAPIVKEIVDGLKTVVGFFGSSIPPSVVKEVKSDERFKDILKDKDALVCIGSALRRQFGDERAAKLMNTFGVRMVITPNPQISKTPDIASSRVPQAAKINGRAVSVAQGAKTVLKSTQERVTKAA
jgi:hypothetical protein